MKPLVSVIVPTYNYAQFLRRALQSVIDQTYPYWEVLVIDNHSNDNTDDVVSGFQDSRIKLFKIHNRGVIAASRNLGMHEARGEWIAFLDSDDFWYTNKLEVIMNHAITDSSCDVLSNDELMVCTKTGTSRILRHGPYNFFFYETLLVGGNRLSPSATVVRRSFLIENELVFDESKNYVAVEDYGFWLDLARNGAKFKFIRQVLGEFLIHGDNSSIKLSQYLDNLESLLHDHVFLIQKFCTPDLLWKKILPRLNLGRAKHHIIQSQKKEAFLLILKTLIKLPRETLLYFFLKL